ncbi:MAG: chromate transporter [Clostridia bacterium]|nr:chromate transporter [Clostridia bacterium]
MPLRLFLTFFKIGLFTFGGGYAMIALLENECVRRKAWLDEEEFLDVVAVAESTPGPIAVNSSTYIGYKTAGFLGALSATLGVVLPSFCIIFAISLFFDRFLALRWVSYAFRGVQVCVVYLIAAAGLKMLGALKKNALTVTVCAAVFGVFVALSLFSLKFSSIFYILVCGAIGLAVYACGRLNRKRADAAPPADEPDAGDRTEKGEEQ